MDGTRRIGLRAPSPLCGECPLSDGCLAYERKLYFNVLSSSRKRPRFLLRSAFQLRCGKNKMARFNGGLSADQIRASGLSWKLFLV